MAYPSYPGLDCPMNVAEDYVSVRELAVAPNARDEDLGPSGGQLTEED
jgi:hypothetical protein